jgi:hypothetical protein
VRIVAFAARAHRRSTVMQIVCATFAARRHSHFLAADKAVCFRRHKTLTSLSGLSHIQEIAKA